MEERLAKTKRGDSAQQDPGPPPHQLNAQTYGGNVTLRFPITFTDFTLSSCVFPPGSLL